MKCKYFKMHKECLKCKVWSKDDSECPTPSENDLDVQRYWFGERRPWNLVEFLERGMMEVKPW